MKEGSSRDFVQGTTLTSEEVLEWSKAPLACPRCVQPFMRWSACVAHLHSVRTCGKAYIGVDDVRSVCEKTALSHSGQLKAPVSLPSKRIRHQRRGSFATVVETEEELQAIQEDMERAVFGARRRNNSVAESYLCICCGMNDPDCSFAPCGHAVACRSCTSLLNPTNCPFCGQQVEGIL